MQKVISKSQKSLMERAKPLRVCIWEMRETINYIDNIYHKFLFITSSNRRTKEYAMKLRDNKF